MKFHRFFTSDGTETGGQYVSGDYSTTRQDFWLPSKTKTLTITQVHIYLAIHNGAFQRYGSGVWSLNTGVRLGVRDKNDGIVRDLTGGVPIKTNSQWSNLAWEVAIDARSPNNFPRTVSHPDDLYIMRYTLDFTDDPVVVLPRQRVVARVNDDLRSIFRHRFSAEGTVF